MKGTRETAAPWWRKPWLLTVPGVLLFFFSLPEQQENLAAWKRILGSVGKSTWQVAAGYVALLCFAVSIIMEGKARVPVLSRALRQLAEHFVLLLGQGMGQGMEIGRSKLRSPGESDQPPGEGNQRPLPAPTRVGGKIHDDENWITVSSLWPGLIDSSHVVTLVVLNGMPNNLARRAETAHRLIECFSEEQNGSAYRNEAVHRDTWEEWLRALVRTRVEQAAG